MDKEYNEEIDMDNKKDIERPCFRGTGCLAQPGGDPVVAYFSMEVGLRAFIPTYSGGLGVLAGDTLRAAADLRLPIVGLTLLHRQGYFRQSLDPAGNQTELPVTWDPWDHLEPLDERIQIRLGGREVHLRAWRYCLQGHSGACVPVYFLDTDLPGNAPEDRGLTGALYAGDSRYRFSQEAVLGLGGVAMLRRLGYRNVRAFHMNEGHSALLGIALLREIRGSGSLAQTPAEDMERVRRLCVFTTHTPVPEGHDKFSISLVRKILGKNQADFLEKSTANISGELNMTSLALLFSRYVNGVSRRHEEVSQNMFPDYPIHSITNGVHAGFWASPSFRRLFDLRLEGWRGDNVNLRYAVSVPLEEISAAHREAKRELLDEVGRRSGVRLDPDILTIGFARRATAYKRANLLFSDIERLKRIASRAGAFQIIFGGKAHPRDEGGKAMIREIFQAAGRLKGSVPVVYLEEYDMALARYLVAGVDVWLNTPQKPKEASGTSGMKAALNGVPSFSVLDGWWVEGHIEGVTGWAISDSSEEGAVSEAESLFTKLETVILPMFYDRPREFAAVRRSAISLNGSFFTAQRMMHQYIHGAYELKEGGEPEKL
jgi:starch phosphorylase